MAEEDKDKIGIKLIRGKDHYRWEICLSGESSPEIIKELEQIDTELRQKYLTTDQGQGMSFLYGRT
jgi:hypothetical protein